MARELGGSQISALLESVPGIANVLRSPVADALMGMIRAGAGVGEFKLEHAKELVQYAVRRGLIQSSEGDEVLAEVQAGAAGRRAAQRAEQRAAKSAAPARRLAQKPGIPKATSPSIRRHPGGSAKKAAKPPASIRPPARQVGGRPVKKASKTMRRR